MAKSLEAILVKAPHRAETYTLEQIAEFVKCADPVTGPAHFLSNYFYIQHATKGKMKYAPFPYQLELARIYHNYRFSVNLLGRQLGKTTTAAGYLLWYAMYVPDSTILVAAHKFTGSQEIMARIRFAYESCPDHIRAGATSYNKGSLEFDNGSRIISTTTTENTGRGLSISLLYSDELAFVRNTIAREFWTSISPTLATGGKAIITSTPNSDDDLFWDLWKGANNTTDEFGNPTDVGRNGFKAFQAIWSEHPDRDAKWESEERVRVGNDRFEREHNCRPIVYEETLIDPLLLADLSYTDPIQKQGQVRWYSLPQKGHTYVVGLDPSLGTGGDDAAIQVYDTDTLEQVAEWQHNKTPIKQQVELLSRITAYLADNAGSDTCVYYSVENNAIGEAALLAISEIGEENIRGAFISESKKLGQGTKRKGFTTTNRSKLAACAKFKQLVENKRMRLRSRNLLSQLKNFTAHKDSFEAKAGEKDDLVSAALLVTRMMQELKNYDPALDERFTDASEVILPLPFIML